MNALSQIVLYLVVCVAFTNARAELRPSRTPLVGVATDPNANTRVGVSIEGGASDERPEDPKRADGPGEISSPARVITPVQNPPLEETEEGDDADLPSNPSRQRTSDPQVSQRPESPLDSPNMPAFDHLLLSILGMDLNQSRSGRNSSSSFDYLSGPSGNCSDLSCFYATRPDDEVTTSQSEINEDMAAEPTEVQDPESNDTPHEFFLYEKSHPLASNSTSDRSNEISAAHDSVESPPEFSWGETNEGDGFPEQPGNRVLTFGPAGPVLGRGNHLSPVLGQTGSVSSPNTSNSRNDRKLTFIIDTARIIPSFNTTREIEKMDVPDIVPLLQRCGVFVACHLHLTASADVINNDAHAYEKHFSGQITTRPEFMNNVLKITCDPTSVSIIIAFAIVLAIVIVVSNIVIIIVTLRTKALRKPHGYFKISLAVADFINGAFVLTSMCSNMVRNIHFDDDEDRRQIIQMRKDEPIYSEAVFFGVCGVLTQVATVYSLLLLSVDSFLSIRWPMQYRVGDLMTAKRSWILIAVVWSFALAVSALPVLAHDYVRYGLSYSTFSFLPILRPLDQNISREDAFLANYIHILLYALLVWGIPFFATWMLTVMTAYHSRGMLRSMSSSRKKGPGVTKKIDRLQRDIFRTVSIVLVMLTLTVLPIIIFFIVTSVTAYNNKLCLESQMTNFLFAAYYVLSCGSFMNVIVYNACNKEFRRSTFDLLSNVISYLFSCICPNFCDLRPNRSNKFKSSSGQGTRRTTLSSDSRKNRLTSLSSKGVINTKTPNGTGAKSQTSIPMEVQSHSSGYHESSGCYGRTADHSDGSDVPSSSRTVSTATSSSTSSSSSASTTSLSSRNQSSGSESSNSSNTRAIPPRKTPAQRAASCSSVFTPSRHSTQGSLYYGR